MIVVICGPPGAGKTTLTNRVRERLETRDVPVAVETLHSDDFSSRTYDQLYERARDATAEITLVDGTFYRREWQTQFRTLPEVRVVHVTASLETCLERNRTRADPIAEQGVHVVYREFDEPDAEVTIDTDRQSVPEAVDRILIALEEWGWLESKPDVSR
ncbi:ATP-binding protein [Halopiger aswanensis]|uniref:Adenylylsulfate kinase n=1 Tax=Halopiger aswanensis TaxID=148449 RepID=A0A3R7EDC6_9EURY|nr:AAA family ATPase [Halopiger aswanensis]RKD93487.1 adenylylsulfate kinase [Halopiger aswanensis]